MLLRRRRSRNDRRKTKAVTWRYDKPNSRAHPPSIAHPEIQRNPNSDSFVPVNPLGLLFDDFTTVHKSFVDAFWEEEPSFDDYKTNQRNRYQLPRKKITAYISRMTNNGASDSKEIANKNYISRMYSGFVHGAAPHLMDLFNPVTRLFDVSGVTNHSMFLDHRRDFENLLFRGIGVVALAARTLKNEPLLDEAMSIQRDLEENYF